jgi:hypothetical protein
MAINVEDVIDGDLLFPYTGPADGTPPGNRPKSAGFTGHVGIVTTTIEPHGAALFTRQVDGATLKGT